MTDLFLRPLFTWRSAVASKHGPSNPTTRHVLLTLALHMNEKGGSCFPSIDLLVEESGLSRRAVIDHLRTAERDGWIGKRDLRRPNGQGWRRVEYIAQIPAQAERLLNVEQAGAPDAPRQGGAGNALPSPTAPRERGAPGSERGAPGSKGGAPGAPEYFSSTSKNSSKEKTPAASRRSPLPAGFGISDSVRAWAIAHGYEPYLDAHLEYFLDFAVSNRKLYLDWDAAFRNCVRADWGGIRKARRIAAGLPAQAAPKAEHPKCTWPGCSDIGDRKHGDDAYCAVHWFEENSRRLAAKPAPSPVPNRLADIQQMARTVAKAVPQ